jgi:hypothetical protein
MKKYSLPLLIPIFFFLTGSPDLSGQSWVFVKEKEGIRLYTRKEANNSVKSFKGEVFLHTQIEKVFSLITNVKNFDWWDDDISEIKVLHYEKDKIIQYYLIYDVPWPIADRDLVVDSHITIDPVTGTISVEARSLLNVVPERPDLVRIKKYWQKWTLIPVEKDLVHLILEGSVDPGGSVPAWLSNMVITETPLKVIRSVKTHVGAK